MEVRRLKDDELQHHGVKGQKWGVRRYQNYDGTLIGSKGKKMSTKQAKKYAESNNYLGSTEGRGNINKKRNKAMIKTIKKYVNSDGTLNEKGAKKMNKTYNQLTKKIDKHYNSKKVRKSANNIWGDEGAADELKQNRLDIANDFYKSKDVRLLNYADSVKKEQSKNILGKTASITTKLTLASIAASSIYTTYNIIRKTI